ncbi:hypothetical protein BDV98DRAFT_573408 [Pterulicium gracile]|uniref:Actin-like ATPase domain-containing protein n=1 Tax=Pterulicium gracile TaxID=1884261 RepID=A0A5C3QD15_9AGAR|nr:hypothetical protein BDV98DRAFT_573408 [Pterula gracilis]
MAAKHGGPSHFLGLELATDQLRASIVDENLHQVGAETIDFDSELPDYQTQGGIFTTPGDAFTTPVEMWVKALDLLLEKLHRNHDLSRIKSIGGSAQHALVWWKSTPLPSLSTLSAAVPLSTHFPAQSFSIPATPTQQDSSSHSHALMIQQLLGGPDAMAARVGTAAHPGLAAAQMLRVRETWGNEVWARTGRVQVASNFLCSLISGRWMPMVEAEACATGMWVHNGGYWDEGVMEIVGGSSQEGRRLRGWMGDVDVSGGARRASAVSRYLVDRYRFDPETIVTPFTSDYLCSYLSLCPSPHDAVFSFGPIDLMLTPAQNYIPNPMYNIVPHPVQESGERKRYIAVVTHRNADVARALVRDMYTKSWSAFDRLVAIVPPGGSIGLDDKLFSFWRLQPEAHPFSHIKGIFRFETGLKVNEFRDLRANPRCLLESQVLSFRVTWAHMLSTGVVTQPLTSSTGATSGTPSRNQSPSHSHPNSPGPHPGSPAYFSTSNSSTPQPHHPHHLAPHAQLHAYSQPSGPVAAPATKSNINALALGLPFDPYDPAPLPSRIVCTGAAANFPSIVNLLGDIFNSAVYVPNSQVEVAQVAPFRNSVTARASIGGAWIARWAWLRERGERGVAQTGQLAAGGFEEDVKRLLVKSWANGGLRAPGSQGTGSSLSSVHPTATGAPGLKPPGSGSSTPSYAASGSVRSRLGQSVLIEDDEEIDEVGDMAVGIGRLTTSMTGLGLSGDRNPHAHLGMVEGILPGQHRNPGAYNNMGLLHSYDSQRSLGGSTLGASSSSGSVNAMMRSLSSSTSSGLDSISTAYTSPDLSASGSGKFAGAADPANANPAAAPAPGTTTLTPISALPTGEKEAQVAWSKVAEADLDAFMCYASIVPEFCRLERTLIRVSQV